MNKRLRYNNKDNKWKSMVIKLSNSKIYCYNKEMKILKEIFADWEKLYKESKEKMHDFDSRASGWIIINDLVYNNCIELRKVYTDFLEEIIIFIISEFRKIYFETKEHGISQEQFETIIKDLESIQFKIRAFKPFCETILSMNQLIEFGL